MSCEFPEVIYLHDGDTEITWSKHEEVEGVKYFKECSLPKQDLDHSEIPRELIQSLFSFAYCEGLLQGMGETGGSRSHKDRPTTSAQVDDLVNRWLSIEGIHNYVAGEE